MQSQKQRAPVGMACQRSCRYSLLAADQAGTFIDTSEGEIGYYAVVRVYEVAGTSGDLALRSTRETP